MKQILILAGLGVIGLVSCRAQNKTLMENEIKKVVLNLESATAERNILEIEKYLHKDYRVVANRFKGSSTTTIITREVYLEMMQAGKIGGTSYTTEFKSISITDHTAMVDLVFTSDISSNMHKYLILVLDENDQWKVVSDIPVVIEKN